MYFQTFTERKNYIGDFESLMFACALKKNDVGGFKPVTGLRRHFWDMSGVLW
jgi:hypothetical protein